MAYQDGQDPDPGEELRKLAQQYGSAAPHGTLTAPDDGDDPGSALAALAKQYSKPVDAGQRAAAAAGLTPVPGAGASSEVAEALNDADLHPEPKPGIPAFAPSDVTQTPATPHRVPLLSQLTADVGPSLRPAPPLPQRAAAAIGEMAAHPVQTATGIVTALPDAGVTLGKFAAQQERKARNAWQGPDEVSPTEAGYAAGQILASGAAEVALPALDALFGKGMASAAMAARASGISPAVALAGGYVARTGAHAAIGAGVGALFSPNDPAVGAFIGGLAGGLHAAPGKPWVSLPPEEGANLAATPERLLSERAARAPATARVVEPEGGAPASAPAEPDFSVEMNTPGEALAELARRFGGKTETTAAAPGPSLTEPGPKAPEAETTAAEAAPTAAPVRAPEASAPTTSEAPASAPATGPVATIAAALKNTRDAQATLQDLKAHGERRALEEQAKAAFTDALTGLGNDHAWKAAKGRAEADPNLAVLSFDLNGLGTLNDNAGHEAGDAALRHLGHILSQVVGERQAFHPHGDEFHAIVPRAKAAAIRDLIEQQVGVVDVRGPNGPVRYSVSGGFGGTEQAADAAMYARKQSHKAAQGVVDKHDVPQAREEPLSNLDVEPERFQFKQNTNERGVTRALEGVKYNPDLAGVVAVWRDPADGRLKVVNGHHRVELARQHGVKHMLVREIHAPDAATARTRGALINIAEDKGTPVDVAKFLRDTGSTPEDLAGYGVNGKGVLAKKGVALSRLAPALFQQVATGVLPVERGVVIGDSGLAPEQQLALMDMLRKREVGGKRLSNETLAELVRFVRGAGTTDLTQESLFGTEQLTHSLALEKAELSAYVKDHLAKDRRLFGYVSKSERANRLAASGAGQIETARATDLATRAAQAEEVYNRLSTMTGPVANALTEAARQLAQGGDKHAIRQALYDTVSGAVGESLRALSGAEARGVHGVPEGRGGVGPAAERAGNSAATGSGEPGAEPPFIDPDQVGLLGERRPPTYGKEAPPALRQAEARLQTAERAFFDYITVALPHGGAHAPLETAEGTRLLNAVVEARVLRDRLRSRVPIEREPQAGVAGDIGERRRVKNITEARDERARFPMTVERLLDHAEAKGYSIRKSAEVLRREGYTISPTLEREAVKEKMRRPGTPPPDEGSPMSHLKTGEGTVGAGFDRSIFRKLGANLYKGDIASVAVKEGIQNAVDALRTLDAGSDGKIRVHMSHAEHSITIEDNGAGMTPNIAANEFMDIGGSYKTEGASGGFGLAKVGLLASAEHFRMETVAVTGGGGKRLLGRTKTAEKTRTVIEGSGEDWANGTLKYTTEPAPADEHTGTKLAITFDKTAEFSLYNAKELLQRAAVYSRTPYTLEASGDNPYSGGQTEQITPVSVEDQRSANLFPVKDEPITTLRTPGAEATVYESAVSGPPYGSAELHVLNNGLYQFTSRLTVGENGPKVIVVDVKPLAHIDTPNYPFTTNREQLKGKLAQMVTELGMEIRSKVGRRQMETLTRMLADAPDIPMSQGMRVVDTAGQVPQDLLEEIADRPYVRTLGDLSREAMEAITAEIRKTQPIKDAAFGGISTSQSYLGVNIRTDLLITEADRLGLKLDLPDANLIFYNPWTTIREMPASLAPEHVAEWMSNEWWGTIAHEVAHQLSRGHESAFAGVMTRIMAALGRIQGEWLDRSDAMFREILADGHGAIFADYHRLLSHWTKADDLFKKFSDEQHRAEGAGRLDRSDSGRHAAGEHAGAPAGSAAGGAGGEYARRGALPSGAGAGDQERAAGAGARGAPGGEERPGLTLRERQAVWERRVQRSKEQLDLFSITRDGKTIPARSLPDEHRVAQTRAQSAVARRLVEKIREKGLPSSGERRRAIEAAARVGLIDPVGRNMATSADAAAVMAAFRHPAMEILHAFILDKNGRVVAHNMRTSGQLHWAAVPADWGSEIAELARATGGVHVLFGHNHPSGDPTPSGDDVAVTRVLREEMERHGLQLAGHLVIDHDRANYFNIDPATGTRADMHGVPIASTAPWKTSFEARHPEITRPEQAAQYLAHATDPDATTIAFLDGQHQLVALRPYMAEAMAEIHTWLPEALEAHGAGSVVIMAPMKGAHAAFLLARRVMAAQGTLQEEGHWAYPILDVIGVEHDAKGNPGATVSYAERGLVERRDLGRPEDFQRRTINLRPGESASAQVAKARGGGEARPRGRGLDQGAREVPESYRVGERDLFGNEDESEPSQGSLFASREGTESSRSLRETERAARAELEKLRAQERATASPVERIRVAKRIAELERLVNRDKAISPEELKTRARGGSEPGLFGERRGAYGEPPPRTPATKADVEKWAEQTKQSLGLRHLNVYLKPSTGDLALADIEVPKGERNAGIGTKALEALTKFADEHGQRIILTPALKDPRHGTTSRSRLVRFYKRFGFVENKGRRKDFSIIKGMYREPQTRSIGEQRPTYGAHTPESIRSLAGDARPPQLADLLGDIARLMDRGYSLPDAFEEAVENDAARDNAYRPYVVRRAQAMLTAGGGGGEKGARQVSASAAPRYGAPAPNTPPTHPMPEPSGFDGGGRLNPMELIRKTKAIFHPEALGIDARATAGVIRQEDAQRFRRFAQAESALKTLHQYIEKQPRARQVELWDAYESGRSTGDRYVDAANKIFNEVTDQRTQTLIALDRLRAERALENYVGRFWSPGTKGASVASVLRTMFAKRPFEGPKSFLKARSLEHFTDGLDAGLIPATYNYVESQLAKIAEMERLIAAEQILRTEQKAGRAQKVLLGQTPPEDAEGRPWVRIDREGNDPAFTVWGPREGMVKLPDEAKQAGVSPDDVEVIGPRPIGHWYATASSAAVWQNYLSRGLRGNPIYQALTAPGSAATSILLGISGFHGTVIATEGMFSDLALAMDHLASGEPAGAARAVGRAVTSPVAGVALGRRILQEYRVPGTHPELAQVLEAMIAGGFRGQEKSELWHGDRTKALKKAVNDALHGDSALRQAWGASRIPLDAIYAGIEAAAYPLMGKYVPLMKAAATYQAVAKRLSELPKNVPPAQLHDEMWDIVKEMDFRFGHVVYDNHFINNVAKHLAQAMFLAPGWTFGTVALMTRGARDVARVPKRAYDRARGAPGAEDQPLLGRSAKYWIAAVAATMLMNGLITYALTGDTPGANEEDGWKDFFLFRDGTFDVNGNPNRHTIPGYIMHDVYGWTHHPVGTFLNKLSPFWAFAARVAENRTYYGDMIVDPDAPLPTRAAQVAKAAGHEFIPLSVQNYLEGRKRDEASGGEMVRNVLGVAPAKRELVRTEAQNRIADYLSRRGKTAETPDEADAHARLAKVLQGLRGGGNAQQAIMDAIQHGDLTTPQFNRMMKRAGILPFAEQYKTLTLEQALDVFSRATPWERGVLADILNQKITRAGRSPK